MAFRTSSMLPRKRQLLLLLIIYIGFISLGLPDTILGVVWGAMRIDLDQPVAQAGILTLVLAFCSAISSFASGAILRRVGTGKLLAICGLMTGLALLGYGFAPAFWLLVILTIPLGFGQGAVDTGMNYYVAKHYSSRDMSWLHCCWGIGATTGPMLATMVLSSGGSWRWSYRAVGGIQLLLAAVFFSSLSLWGASGKVGAAPPGAGHARTKPRRDARFWYCVVMFWLYTGFEAGTGLWAYTFLTTCRGISPRTAGYAVAGYWGMLTVGRFLVGMVANRLGNTRQISYSIALAMICGILMAIPGWPSLTVAALGMLGFAAAPFYPAMMHAAPERFDDVTAGSVIGYQGGAGVIGTMTIPAAFGLLASHTSFELLPYLVALLSAGILLAQIRVDGKTSTPR